ncbi:hypothetical protein, partial [Enterobacter cloacae complex sp. 4DZ3-17B2]|uniref:hypothetical protein n=1 Tax=Enterobacter cloacae complex sp. 4DZ3-17B2 TaxID=2511990 RepID=UPI001CA56B61
MNALFDCPAIEPPELCVSAPPSRHQEIETFQQYQQASPKQRIEWGPVVPDKPSSDAGTVLCKTRPAGSERAKERAKKKMHRFKALFDCPAIVN